MRIMIHKSCLQLVEDTTAVACRAVLRVKEDDINLAENHFCSKRLKLADRIINKELKGVQFFVSCITAIEQNVQVKISADEEDGVRDPQKIYPTSLPTAKSRSAPKTEYFVHYTARIWIPP